MKRFLLTAVLVLAMGAPAFAADAEVVSGYEVKLFFNGRTADCIKTKDDSTCATFFAKDGEVKRITHNDGKQRVGKWWVSDEGNLCVHWNGKKKPLCFVIKDPRDGTFQLVRKGKLKSIVTGAQPGNSLGW